MGACSETDSKVRKLIKVILMIHSSHDTQCELPLQGPQTMSATLYMLHVSGFLCGFLFSYKVLWKSKHLFLDNMEWGVNCIDKSKLRIRKH